VTRRNNLKKVARVVLDNSSRTSVALLKIIFREFLGFDPEWKVAAPDLKSMLQEADAALIIGDPAMKVPRDQFHVFDLATMWREFTGFGFVFAMWMARSERAELARSVNFAAARDEGLRQLDEIAANYEALGLTRDEVRKYLTENIAFRVDEELAQGMNLYFDLAAKHKLVEVRKKLKFVW
jgi:chorismate dehydratase